MKLELEKSKDQYKLYIIRNDGKKEKFDYIKFINLLYEGNNIDEINYNENISDEEKKQINKMIEDIKRVVEQKL